MIDDHDPGPGRSADCMTVARSWLLALSLAAGRASERAAMGVRGGGRGRREDQAREHWRRKMCMYQRAYV